MFYLGDESHAITLADGLDDTLFEVKHLRGCGSAFRIDDDQRLKMPHRHVAFAITFPSAPVDEPCGRYLPAVIHTIVRKRLIGLDTYDVSQLIVIDDGIFEKTSCTRHFRRVGQFAVAHSYDGIAHLVW